MQRNNHFRLKLNSMKRIRRVICVLSAITVFLSASFLGNTIEAFAVTKSQLQAQKNEAQKKLDSAKSSVNSIQEEKEEAQAEVDEIDSQLVELLAAMDILEEELSAKKIDVENSQKDYDAAKAEEDKQYEAMKKRIRFMYEKGDVQYMELLLESQSIADAINKADFAEKVYDYDRKLLEDYQHTKEEAEALHERYVNEEAELEGMQVEYKEQQSELEQTLSEKKAVVENFDEKLSKARSEAKKYESQVRAANTEIAKIVAAEKAAAEKAAREKAAREKAAKEAAEKAAKEAASSSAKKNEGGNGDEDPGGPVKEEPAPAPSSGGSAKGREVADFACQFIGNPYVSGGSSLTNGTDCSGFTMSVYSHFGYSIPRTSSQQLSCGKGVSYSEAQPGDIMCYAGHVGIYIGNGMIVHASTPATGIKTTVATYRPILAVRRII